MLWVSEGFTIYYEYLMLARSRADDAGGAARGAPQEHRRLREQHGAAIPVGHPIELRYLEPGTVRPRERGRRSQDDLVLREGPDPRDAPRLQDPARDEEREVARYRDARALREVLQGARPRMDRRGVPPGVRERCGRHARRELRLRRHDKGDRLREIPAGR